VEFQVCGQINAQNIIEMFGLLPIIDWFPTTIASPFVPNQVGSDSIQILVTAQI
jgi:hypothetical protein